MRVLVACEFSGTVRDAFAKRGHAVWSCDLLPTDRPGLHYQGDARHLLDGWMPVKFSADCDPDGDGWCSVTDSDPAECCCIGPTQDGIEYLETPHGLFGRPEGSPRWDLIIAHPPCTYLTISAEWAYGNGPYHQQVKPETLVGKARIEAREAAIEFFAAILNAPCERIAIENPVGVISTRIRKPNQVIQPWQFGHDAAKATCLWLKGLPPLSPTAVLKGGRWARRANQTDGGQNRLPPSPDRWKLRAATYLGIAEAMAEQWGEPARYDLFAQQPFAPKEPE